MAIIQFENGTKVEFNGTPTQADIEEVAAKVLGKKKEQVSPSQSGDEESAAEFNPVFASKTGESALSAVAKAAGNLPGSAANFAVGLVKSLNPIAIAKNIGQFGSGVAQDAQKRKQEQAEIDAASVAKSKLSGLAPETQKGIGRILNKPATPSIGDVVKAVPSAAFQTLVPKAAQQAIAGDTIGAQRSLTNDPFGQVAPLVLAAEGGARAIGKGAAVDAAISKTGKLVTEPVKSILGKTKSAVGSAAEFGVAQTTGLAPETIRTLVKDPEAFAKADAAGNTRLTTANKVAAAIDDTIEYMSSTGEQYGGIRNAKTPVMVPEGTIAAVLSEFGVQVGKNGKLIMDAESRPLSGGDVAAIEHFISQYGEGKVRTSNAMMNARNGLDNLSKWDASKTDNSTAVARMIRDAYDDVAKKQIPGLKELDYEYAPAAKLMRDIKRDYINADKTLKDGAINKIANLLGKGKESVLARLEKISPGISSDIRIVKALEDVEYAKGQKVGSYTRSLAGLGGGFAAGGLAGAIVGAILTSPQVAVFFLKNYGRAAGLTAEMISSIKSKMDSGTKLTPKEAAAFKSVIEAAAQNQQPE